MGLSFLTSVVVVCVYMLHRIHRIAEYAGDNVLREPNVGLASAQMIAAMHVAQVPSAVDWNVLICSVRTTTVVAAMCAVLTIRRASTAPVSVRARTAAREGRRAATRAVST